MAHHNAQLVACIDIGFGTTGGPAFSTDIVETRGGFESRNRNWAAARFKYELGLVPRLLSEYLAIKSAFMVCGGRADTFLFKDSTDYSATTTNGKLRGVFDDGFVSNGAGYGIATYELSKTYAFASATYYRPITQPSSPVVYRNAVAVTVGASPGNIAVSGGDVTFVADQTRSITTHTPGATHQLVVASAFSPNFAIGGRIWLRGITGTAATTLNDKSHAITGVVGDTITISTNTTGLTATTGDADFFPQPTDTLTWAGDFNLKVRFDMDELLPPIIDRNGAGGELIVHVQSCPIIEVRE
jgi:uncharacterized protein (TIGR02217 family)